MSYYDLLQSMVNNLFDNSRKASERDGKIEVHLCENETEIILSIEDHGLGMDKKEVEKVKEPFYMVDKSRSRKAGGAGLGLALCAEIVQLHHGILEITSEPNKGCRTVIRFEKG